MRSGAAFSRLSSGPCYISGVKRVDVLVVGALLLGASCGGRTSLDFDPGGSGLGGNSSLGGSGAAPNGGVLGVGGSIALGGALGTGGATAQGARMGAGGVAVGGRGGRGAGGQSGFGGFSSGGRFAAGGGIATAGGFATGGGFTTGGVVGAGGGFATGGLVGTGGAPIMCQTLLDPTEDLVDDMDDGDRFILRVNGRAGSWTDNDDGTLGKLFPPSGSAFVMTPTGDPCHGSAVYIAGGYFTDWGATFGFGLGSPYNASGYRALSFWAKIDAGAVSLVRVGLPDKYTDPDGGYCVANASDPNSCWDTHKFRVTNLTTNWTKIVVPFSSLRQDSWGYQGPFDSSTVFGVTFELPANAQFGIWIDAVALVR